MNPTPNPVSLAAAFKKLTGVMRPEAKALGLALAAILASSGLSLLAPYLFGRAVDQYVRSGNYMGILATSGALFTAFAIAFGCQYAQMRLMGGTGQRVLFRLRNEVFTKLQALPVAFFNRHKSGDLISRINNDTDKLNQFFSETLVRFTGGMFMLVGTAIFILVLDWRLGLAALVPAAFMFVFTRLVSPWVKAQTTAGLAATGAMSAEVQEGLGSFKAIVAFDRRDYFRRRFEEANANNFRAAFRSGLANGVFMPTYEFASNMAMLIVAGYGLLRISQGTFTVGLLLGFLIYVERFYMPLRQIGTLWSSLQTAMSGWDRVSEILEQAEQAQEGAKTSPGAVRAGEVPVIEFRGVQFGYPEGKTVLRGADFALQPGKTYAFVGPTGGGKTTTASLMARLYDPTAGTVLLDGRDIRTYDAVERTQKVGFILQDPFLFGGTVLENIFYGNDRYASRSPEELRKVLSDAGFDGLLSRFDKGMDTPVAQNGDTMSLGQRQLIAFMRAVLREPELLILDEATANIDTVTEKMLGEVIERLPKSTAKVVIAHRLNTIANADEIFFVNGGEIVPAGSFEHAVDMLMHGKRSS